MSGLRRKLLAWFCGSLLVTGIVLGLAAWQFLSWADTPLARTGTSSPQTFQLQLQPGQSLSALASDLSERNHLPSPRRLVLLGRLTGAETRLQAGEYTIKLDTTPRQLLEKLSRGEVTTYDFRIEEGATIAEVLRTLASETRLHHELSATDAEALHVELDLQTDFAEGMFFPETYQFRRGESDRSVLLRAHTAMLEQLEGIWQSRAPELMLSSPQELIVLASIIEKETGVETDRGQISQVFHKRLQDRMLLQTDPTVIYALGQAFDGNLTRAHLKIDSPFNTYRVRGLPPTPIALPSAASLRAAAHPAAGDYLYFVAKGDGFSQFSRTLAEHNRAVRRYQLNAGRGP